MYKETGKKVLGLNEYEYEGVRFLLRKGSSSNVFLFFSSFSKKNESQKYNYVKKILNNKEDNFIFFLDSDSPVDDPRGTYFLGNKDEGYLKSIISIIKYNYYNILDLDFYFFGSSKGGSGALLACLELGKGTVLINAPQIMIAEYLSDVNPSALLEISKTEQQLNNIIIEKTHKDTKDIDINISCGIEDSLHWFSHIKYLIENVKEEVNLRIIPIRGGHDGKALNDYSTLVDAIINKNRFLKNKDTLQRTIEFFENKTSFFFKEFVLPRLEGSNINKFNIEDFKDNTYNVISDKTNLTIVDYQTVIVQISGFEGIPITVYAKNDKNKILAKGGKYNSYEHNFTLRSIDARNINVLTIFMKVHGEKITFNLMASLLKKVSFIEYNEDDMKYLEHISSEYSKVSQKIIRNKNKEVLEKIYIAPSFIDSSDAKLIAQNGIGYSFKTYITNAILKNNLSNKNRILNGFSKRDTTRFLNDKGYSVPVVYKHNVDIKEVLSYEKCVVKPVSGAGSKGVFVKSPKGYLDLRDKQLLSDYEEFEKKYKFYSNQKVIIEELVSDDNGIARDIKVYSFYGASPIALEIIRSNDENFYCYYNEDLNIINDCQDRERNFFNGEGFDKEIFAIAKEVSCLIPLPFIRVDFLVTNNEYKLGELTPIPGFYSRFNNEYDKNLGKEYLRAENRLKKDLLRGKLFPLI